MSCAITLALIGCNKSDDAIVPPSQQFWTVSGKTYLVGSTDPLPGVVVKCEGLSATSCSDGSYELHGVPGGVHELTAEKPDCIAYSQTIEITTDVTHHVFFDFNGTDLSGFVTNGVDGRIIGAEVRLRGYVSYADISGFYQFVHVPQGPDTLHVMHPNYFAIDTAILLRVSNAHVDIALMRDSTLQITTFTSTYVDESLPNTIFAPPDRLYLRGNGNDSLGQNHSGIRRFIYIKFDFPQIFRYPSVSVLDARLELCTDGPYPLTDFQTFAVTSPWTYLVNYSNQPTMGPMLSSGTIGDSLSARYWTVLGTDGFNQLAATYRATGQFFGVVIKGGGYYPIAFYTGNTPSSGPKVTLKLRY